MPALIFTESKGINLNIGLESEANGAFNAFITMVHLIEAACF